MLIYFRHVKQKLLLRIPCRSNLASMSKTHSRSVQSITLCVPNVSERCSAAPSLWDVTFQLQLEDSPDALRAVLKLLLQAALGTAAVMSPPAWAGSEGGVVRWGLGSGLYAFFLLVTSKLMDLLCFAAHACV